MADDEIAVNNELVVCEGKEDSPPVEETEPKVAEDIEKGEGEVVSVKMETQHASDYKRKLEDLDHLDDDEAPTKKQEIDVFESTAEQRSPTTEKVKASPEVENEESGVESGGYGYQAIEESVPVSDAAAPDAVPIGSVIDESVDKDHSEYDGEGDGSGPGQLKFETEPIMNGQNPSTDNIEHDSLDDRQNASTLQGHQDNFPHIGQQASSDISTSCKVEVPNNKVGVLIGKSGDTIRYLQLNSGAKIQITRDTGTDPHTSTRLVELIGTPESISKADQLIKDVLAESEAGGSPSLAARGFSNLGGEQIEIQIPDEKVGVIIGKGGENIKNLQRKSGARIQLLPQHLPDGESSKERTVRITGNKKQAESARELIKIVLNQGPYRPSPLSDTYNQHAFRGPRGPPPAHQWGPRGARPPHHTTGYDHLPRGMYPPQTSQYPQSYGGYPPQQPPPKAWDQQKSAATPSQTQPSGGYDYYNHGGPTPNSHPSSSLTGPIPSSTPAPINYNYGHPQATDGYGHQAPYAQPPPSQQSYGPSYGEPTYSQQPVVSQPGMYGQQSSAPYGKPAYAAPHDAQSTYGQPRVTQPVDPMYQGPPPAQYPSGAPTQQSYPYGTTAPTQQAPPYGQAYGPTDAYSQQPTAGYPTQGYAGQAPATYTQPAPQAGGYSQYPSSQAGYVDQSAQPNVNYGYQAVAPDAGYAGNVPTSSYAAPQPVATQPVYSQPPANPSGYYDPSNPPQSGYVAAPTAPTTYANTVPVQPGYSGQYDASQMYGHH